MSSTEYPTPPGSGNAYSRHFLARFFPIGAQHDGFTDSTCLALAPLLGDVVTVAEPLVLYRIHGSNDSNLLAANDRFGREISRAFRRQQSATAICAQLGVEAPSLSRLRYSRRLLQMRAASLRIDPGNHPLKDDNRSKILIDALSSFFVKSSNSFFMDILVLGLSALILLAPRRIAFYLICKRFR